MDNSYEEKISFTVDEDVFEDYVGRKPNNMDEFLTFVHYVEKGMDAQLDWDCIYSLSAEAL